VRPASARARAGGVPRQPVIVGFDGSDPARHALAYAAGIARQIGRPLLVVYVIPSSVDSTPLIGQLAGLPFSDALELEPWLLAELGQVVDPADPSVHVCTRRGKPARELAAMAAELSADAIVIGASARLWHQVAGSVAGWLAGHARCTVIVVP